MLKGAFLARYYNSLPAAENEIARLKKIGSKVTWWVLVQNKTHLVVSNEALVSVGILPKEKKHYAKQRKNNSTIIF